jgi:hypothetical protein
MGGLLLYENKWINKDVLEITRNILSLCEITEVGSQENVCRYVYGILLKVKEGRNEFICT